MFRIAMAVGALLYLAGTLAGCASPSAAAMAQNDYQAIIARSLSFYQGDSRHFSITEPWAPLVGGVMVCVRSDIPDGRGGFAPTTDYSMYQLDEGRIIAMIKDTTIAGCPNRTYSDFSPIPRN